MLEDWQSSIAEADFADWVTVAAYLITASISITAVKRATRRQEFQEATFWRLTAAALMFLGVNELLDLQTLLTLAGRAHAKNYGWYGEHRSIQVIFVVALGVAFFITAAAMLWFARLMHYTLRLAIIGLTFIGVFVLFRAASFHHLDGILGLGMPEFNLGSIQEMTGILVVAGAAALYSKKTE